MLGASVYAALSSDKSRIVLNRQTPHERKAKTSTFMLVIRELGIDNDRVDQVC
jgi:hypothetical protein